MYRSLSPYPAIGLLTLCILLAGLSSACSRGPAQQSGGSGRLAPGTGGIAFQLAWQQRLSGAKALSTPLFNACVDNAIGTIAATVSTGTSTAASLSWPCSAHEGIILGVAAGTNYTVRVNGLSSGTTPTTIWSGVASPVTVIDNQITDVGTIVMSYVGADATRPTVISIAPHSSPASTTNVPVTDRFTIAFNEPMAISTITATSIALIDSGTSNTVSGVVSYVSASNAAEFTPSANLSPDTTYVLQVSACAPGTSCITDLGGNQLASDYTSTFSTEPAPAGIPAAPSGVTAAPGNGQVKLDWLATNGSTSYNVYYGIASGVTTTTGTQIPDVRAPLVHLGLVNSTPYYYIVTSANSFGESPASAEVTAMPVFPGGTPLPPASIAVTFSTGQNSITWPAVSGATTYNLYWSTMPITADKYSADHGVRNVTSPSTHTGLADGLHCYLITAMNAFGESGDSMQVCGGTGGIQFTW